MAQPVKPRLVVLDVEGVLIPKNRFLFEVGKTLGVIGLFKVLIWGFLYEAGLIKLESALKHIYGDLKHIKIETILNIFGRIPATPYLQSLCVTFRARNGKTAKYTTAQPQQVVR